MRDFKPMEVSLSTRALEQTKYDPNRVLTKMYINNIDKIHMDNKINKQQMIDIKKMK